MRKLFSWSIGRMTLGALLLCGPAPIIFSGCTNLTEVPQDALTPTNAFKTDAEVLAGVASVYANLRSTMDDRYNLSEITTDEIIVPTRGQDWYDNGRWLEIFKHNWTPNSGSALTDMNGAWSNLFAGVARANLMIDIVQTQNGPNAAPVLAELRTLRAWYYYLLMDMFGGVPLVTGTKLEALPKAPRDSIFKFVEAELIAAGKDLPVSRPADQAGRLTKGVADAILASLYLNAQVYTGTVTAAGLQKGPARWADAIAAADRVINSGQYALSADWRKNFSPDNHDSKENIFFISNTDAQPGLGMNFPHRTLHYSQLNVQGGPWNGFATVAETYNAFDPADARRNIFLVGPQVSFDNGQPVNDRAGNPLVFSITIGNETQAAENEGPRYNKFSPKPGIPDGSSEPNNFPFFRLAEMYLIKAEALNELGQPDQAIAQVNIIRDRQFSPPKPLATGQGQAATRTAIFNERLFELTGEGKRRSDMIRAGTFVDARRFKGVDAGHKILFPIPQTQISSNPQLTQNPGY
jgi:starch-binding outer membrane protein, SusD/RagB family